MTHGSATSIQSPSQSLFAAPSCGHVFCKECLNDWIKKKPSCPLDQQSLPSTGGSFQVDFVLAELLSEFEILCPNDCSWTGFQRDLTAHRSSCPNESIQCSNPGCNESQLRKEMVRHQEACPHLTSNKAVVTLNVGGRMFQTLRMTLTKHENTYFTKLFKGEIPAYFDNQGNYFIDRDGDLFLYILHWLRTGIIELSSSVSRTLFENELKFYQLFDRITLPPSTNSFRFVAAPLTFVKVHQVETLLNQQASEGFYPTKDGMARLLQIRESHRAGQNAQPMTPTFGATATFGVPATPFSTPAFGFGSRPPLPEQVLFRRFP